MVRRKTKGGKWKNQVCRACESFLTPKKERVHVHEMPKVGVLGRV